MANKFPLTINTSLNQIQELVAGDNLDLSNSAIYANGSVGTAGQILASNGTAVYWTDANPGDITGVTAGNGLSGGGSSGSVTVSVAANTGLVANAAGIFVNTAYIATLSANNTTYVNGKTEGNLNVNNATTATTANNSTYAFGKSEADINANSALTANNSTYAFGKSEAGINANSALTANNSTYAFGKSEAGINANSALTANNSTYFDGATWAAPKALGSGTANTGAFTTLGSGNTTITGALTSNGSIVTNVVAVGASAIDCRTGTFFTKTASGGLTWTTTNIPASGAYAFILELTNGGTGTQTWMSGTKWPGGTAPTLVASGVDVLGFITDDGGTTWRGVQIMADSK